MESSDATPENTEDTSCAKLDISLLNADWIEDGKSEKVRVFVGMAAEGVKSPIIEVV